MENFLDPDCIFCKIIRGEIPSHKVYENDYVYAFFDINPLSLGHTLVIPKYHAQKTHELPLIYSQKVGEALNIVAKALVKTFNIDNYNILQNNGRIAHQKLIMYIIILY